jgi:hypothetical protein
MAEVFVEGNVENAVASCQMSVAIRQSSVWILGGSG